MQIVKSLFRISAAGVVAVAIISVLLCFYDYLPVHVENKMGNTDYVWPANSIWVKATEGVAFGKFDANGFNNKVIVDNPDIIFLGSSHMEATNVMQKENAPFLLSKKLDGKYSVYNMGISGHNFFRVCQYLPKSLELYTMVPKVVVIETSTVSISQKEAGEAISFPVMRTPIRNTGMVGILQKIPFFKAVYHQMAGGILKRFMPEYDLSSEKKDKDYDIAEDIEEITGEIETDAYEEIFSYLNSLEEKTGTQILVFFHPTEKLMEDGTIYFDRSEALTAFAFYAKKYGISFVDLTDRFEKMYYDKNHVAHGFCTGKIAAGHLNRFGHAAVADELYNEIIRLEEAGEICQ